MIIDDNLSVHVLLVSRLALLSAFSHRAGVLSIPCVIIVIIISVITFKVTLLSVITDTARCLHVFDILTAIVAVSTL